MSIQTFNPVLLSEEENTFLMANLGQPPVVAAKAIKAPVNPRAVLPIIERVFELEQLKTHEATPWVGVEVIKQAIKTWLEQDAKWRNDFERTRGRAPRFPSMYSYDSKGRAHRGGPGSDTHIPKTYFDKAGNRLNFEVDLLPEYTAPWTAPGFTEQLSTPGLTVNQELSRIECFCGHTESFKGESRSSYNAARARMSKHLRKATENVEQHREAHTLEFGG
jgi:hypothetical protein